MKRITASETARPVGADCHGRFFIGEFRPCTFGRRPARRARTRRIFGYELMRSGSVLAPEPVLYKADSGYSFRVDGSFARWYRGAAARGMFIQGIPYRAR